MLKIKASTFSPSIIVLPFSGLQQTQKQANTFKVQKQVTALAFEAKCMEEEFFPILQEKELQEGKMKRVSVDGTPILLIKQPGKIFAIDNRCPHKACGFSNGTLDGLVIVCPCHDWRFNLETGEYEDDPLLKLKIYDWKIKCAKSG